MSDSKVTKVSGRAVPVVGDAIDTDRIIPARYLKEITFTNMGKYPFFDERFDANGNKKDHPFNEPRFQGASILFVNANFGCGSSREHAPQAIMRWGIKALVAESYAEIFSGNCMMLGIPAVTTSPENVKKLQAAAQANPSIEWTMDLNSMTIHGGGTSLPITMPDSRRNSLVNGTWDSTAVLLANRAQVMETVARLPYLNRFAA